MRLFICRHEQTARHQKLGNTIISVYIPNRAKRIVAVFLLGVIFAGSIPAALALQLNGHELSSEDLDVVDPNLNNAATSRTVSLPGQQKGWLSLAPLSSEEFEIAELQVLLDRSGFSPGAINGQLSDHFDRVLKIYRAQNQMWDLDAGSPRVAELLRDAGGEAFEEYTLTAEDVRGPFVSDIPERIQDQAFLKKLSFQRVQELLAERFHMDEDFLGRLNMSADFTKPGTVIKVANIGRYLDIKVSRILAVKELRQVTAYDNKGRIVAVYPASIGSQQNPSPQGEFTVRNKAGFPAYTLAPDNGFEIMDSNQQVVVAPGPNNPVGIAWIGLSKKTFGIHGTPEPSQIGKSASNGCIRLTNWDALELAKLVSTGIPVTIR